MKFDLLALTYGASWLIGASTITFGLAIGYFFRAARQAKAREEELERLIEEREAELQRAQQQLEEARQTVDAQNRDLDQANQLLHRITYIDEMTGLANRRYFGGALDIEWRRAQRSKEYLSLLMIDIDFFKSFNEVYGVPRGDDVLKQIAKTLAESVNRAGDVTARYSGKQFVVILPETDPEGAGVVAKEIQNKIRALAIPSNGGTGSGMLSVSIGGASALPREGIFPDVLIDAAEEALRRASMKGGDRMVILDKVS